MRHPVSRSQAAQRSQARQTGQATVEWIGLTLLIALLAVGVLAVAAAEGGRFPGAGVARTLAAKILCAADIGGRCAELGRAGTGDPLLDTYGDEVGGLLREHAPIVLFESGDWSLPTDFRHCRERRCSDAGTDKLRARSSRTGMQPTAFTRVIDCRAADSGDSSRCTGIAEGNLYLQYWLYYPDSYTAPWGEKGFHPDDWESYQVRIGPDGSASARASSHNSYNHGAGIRGTLSDLGNRYRVDLRAAGWGPATGYLWVSGGSHAGRVIGGRPGHLLRDRHLRLVALEPEIADLEGLEFAVTPPWEKAVWSDPESRDT